MFNDSVNNSHVVIEELPFRHVIIDNFLKKDVYDRLNKEHRDIVSRGVSEKMSPLFYSSFQDGGSSDYDAYRWSPNVYEKGSAFGIFADHEWYLFAQKIFNIPITPHMVLSSHYHLRFSEKGNVHHDYAFVLLKEHSSGKQDIAQAEEGGTIHPTKENTTRDGYQLLVRSLSFIYYYGNAYDEEGGGETGLFSSSEWHSLAEKVAPINNRLLLFEISPKSFHSFLENKKFPRTSLVGWFHEKPETMRERFGVEPSFWPSRKKETP